MIEPLRLLVLPVLISLLGGAAAAAPPTATVPPAAPQLAELPGQIELLHALPATVGVSSSVDNGKDLPQHLVDGDPGTAWNSRTGDLAGAWVEVALPSGTRVGALRLTAGFTRAGKVDLFTANPRVRRVRVVAGGQPVHEQALDVTARGLQLVRLPEPVPGDLLRLEVLEVQPGSKAAWKETCLSELEVWGWPPAGTPLAAGKLTVRVGPVAEDPDRPRAPTQPALTVPWTLPRVDSAAVPGLARLRLFRLRNFRPVAVLSLPGSDRLLVVGTLPEQEEELEEGDPAEPIPDKQTDVGPTPEGSGAEEEPTDEYGVPEAPCGASPIERLVLALLERRPAAEGGGWKELARRDAVDLQCQLHAWPEALADLDRDGRPELLLGYSWTHNDYAACRERHRLVVDATTLGEELDVVVRFENSFESYCGQSFARVRFGEGSGAGRPGSEVVVEGIETGGTCSDDESGWPLPLSRQPSPTRAGEAEAPDTCSLASGRRVYRYEGSGDRWVESPR